MLDKYVTSYFHKMNKVTLRISVRHFGIFFKGVIFLLLFMDLIVLNVCILRFFEEDEIEVPLHLRLGSIAMCF